MQQLAEPSMSPRLTSSDHQPVRADHMSVRPNRRSDAETRVLVSVGVPFVGDLRRVSVASIARWQPVNRRLSDRGFVEWA